MLVLVTLSDIVNSIQSFRKIQYVEFKKIASENAQQASSRSFIFISFCQNGTSDRQETESKYF